MESIQNYTAAVSNYRIQQKTHEGKRYLVVPVVMMVEGVHNGSHGPVLHTAAELGKYPAAWNGIPVTIGHPQDGQGYISANAPTVIERYGVGKIYNTRLDANKLKAEAWIDVQKITALSPVALAYLRQGKPLEVSIGAFTDEDRVTGTHNGEDYQAIARNHRPDHLALLPGEQGACSWLDGCGIRSNSNHDKNNQKPNVHEHMNDEEILKEKERGITRIGEYLAVHAVGLRARLDAVARTVDGWDNTRTVHYLEEVFEDYFVFRRNIRNPNGPSTEQGYFRQNYTMAENVVTLEGNELPVKKEVSYTAIQANASTEEDKPLIRTKKKGKTMTEEKSPCFLAKVESLIANEASPFTEDQKDWLLTQEEPFLDKLMPKKEEPKKPAEEAPQGNQAAPTVNSVEEFIASAPAEMQDQMRSGLRLHREHRETLIQSIMNHSQKEAFKVEELRDMDTGMLEKIKKALPVPADYSLNGGQGATPQVNVSVEPLLPPGVKAEEKK